VQLYQPANQREADPQAALRALERRIALIEHFEQLRQLGGRDSDLNLAPDQDSRGDPGRASSAVNSAVSSMRPPRGVLGGVVQQTWNT
jgi:hypothetical protein